MYKKINLKINSDESLKFFLNKGIVSLSRKESSLSKQEIDKFRNILEEEFRIQEYPRDLYLDQLINNELKDKIQEILNSKEIKNFFLNLSKKYGEIAFFPPGHIMRNYFSSPGDGWYGWHNDANGEYAHEFTREKLKSGNYLFGKISLSFQFNRDTGGNIDIALSTFKPNTSRVPTIQKISMKLQKIFFSFFKNSPSLKFINFDFWLTDLFSLITKPRTINPKPMEILIFDHRLFHRGSPFTPRGYSRVKKSFPNIFLKGDRLLPKESNLGEMNKYVFYIHFGNQDGLDSYVFDRSFRNELYPEVWEKQLKDLDIFKKFFKNSHKMYIKALEKLKRK